jgi:superfamily II DNA or RNA helicase
VPLKSLDFPATLDTSSADIIADFFTPALKASVHYDRGVGFFSAGWLRVAAEGMAAFACNSGRARWVTSPILSEKDWQALQLGEAARYDEVLRQAVERSLDDLEQVLEQETLSALAWLVADGILDFKLALPRNKLDRGEFHDKFGIFTDTNGNRVSFNGSYNDSIQGTRNYESIKIFCSWQPTLASLVDTDAERFERLWNNFDSNVQVFDLPEAARARIVHLRSEERPYPEPDWEKLRSLQEERASQTICRLPYPHVPPHIALRDYQTQAIDAWFDAGCRGLFEMATGTGKTITALAAAVHLFDEQKRLVLVITCPFKHLVEQWSQEALQFGFRPIQVAESRKRWEPEVTRQLQVFRRKGSNLVTIITTNASLRSGVLPEILQEYWSEAALIADEAHNVGAPQMLTTLPPQAPWRLGLSATPVRHYDEFGTEAILDYFGEVVFEFGLEKAIGTYLTPYYYYPIPVEMTEDEFEQFCVLTRKILRYVRGQDKPLPEPAKKLAIKRARVMNNSISKLDWLQDNIEGYAKLQHALFYVGDKLFDQVKEVLGVEKRIRVHEFTQRQNNAERGEILRRFAEGDLQALVAMKCLDEGVDVPPTRIAYFLASSGNPREFVQRRGRVLRRWEGKRHATIYDLISTPPSDFIELGKRSSDYGAVRAAVRREYRRVKEFAGLAENHYQALDELFDIADRLDLLDIDT